ncbi:DUF5123 domain-containing protein [Segetibacter sp. 3557_3]|uniref:DUF5123 domain-containing protein n=1 Tax=Segetibacter sp. 3557_3 TaxID=2547429 RepID=UPI001404EAD8|nr:DUF5123 domain-containing protein [Segetibacter sp. 3557_3]
MSFKNIYNALLLSAILVVACRKADVPEPARLFRPVIAGQLSVEMNNIAVGWQLIKGSTSYTLQLSRDTFKTIDVSKELTVGVDTVRNLQYDKLYQVRVRANAGDSVFSSRWSNLGEIKTLKFPTILNTPSASDVTEEALRVSWVNGGAPVTRIRVLKATDSTLVREVMLTPADVANQFKVISGLVASTGYIAYLYSGATVRGWENYTTKAPLSGNIVDLRSITGRPGVLADTLPLIPSGSTIVLKRGETYNIASAINLSKAVTIVSGSDLQVPDPALIFFTSNFNFAAGSVIEYIDFRDVVIRSDNFGSRYIFNTTNSAAVGRISFENCKVEIFRGMIRLQSGTTTITDFVVNNSILDSLSNYGVITVDNVTCKAENISITNSTIYKAEVIIVSRSNSTSVKVEYCTINEAPKGGSYLVDYNTTGSNNVSSGVKINNNIFGVGKSNAGAIAVRGIRIGTGAIESANNYSTADYTLIAATPSPIPNVTPYSRKSTELWQDPYNGNFKISDLTFPGRTNTGDPRWK